MMLNAEAIAIAYLREQSSIEALKARVEGKTPSTLELPWIRVTQLDAANATETTQVEWLVGYYLQLDCYAGSKGGRAEAFALTKAAREALVAFPDAELEDAVPTDVHFLSMARIPDTDFTDQGGARERYVLDTEIYMHPKP